MTFDPLGAEPANGAKHFGVEAQAGQGSSIDPINETKYMGHFWLIKRRAIVNCTNQKHVTVHQTWNKAKRLVVVTMCVLMDFNHNKIPCFVTFASAQAFTIEIHPNEARQQN